jgi:hypothetical protein
MCHPLTLTESPMPQASQPSTQDPASVVQRQLDAYNARDIEGLLATYAQDAEQYALHGGLLARGHGDLRPRFAERFAEPDLHALLLHRAVVGKVVVDHELITRNFPEGRGTLEMLCLYEVEGGLIRKATFATGARKLTDQISRSTVA